MGAGGRRLRCFDGVACEGRPPRSQAVVPPADPLPALNTSTTVAGDTRIIPVTTTTIAGQTPATVRQVTPAAPTRRSVALTG